MTAVNFNSNISDDARRQRLYQGELFVYSVSDATRALCEFARELCEQAFAPHHPQEAQHHLTVEEFIAVLGELKPKFIHHPRCKELIPRIFEELGCDLEKLFFDVPRIRTSAAGDYCTSGLAYAFKPHRDTWYSTPMCQLNWWLPVYEIGSNNCMAFHPEYWNRAVKNSSTEFNYQDWNSNGRMAAAKQVKTDTRVQSEALEPINLEPDLRVVPEPGGLFIFSAAQLHSSVSNTSDKTRISIDFRTVHYDDLEIDGGAVNIDSDCSGTTIHDYLKASDLSHIPDHLIDYFEISTRPELSLASIEAQIDAATSEACQHEQVIDAN